MAKEKRSKAAFKLNKTKLKEASIALGVGEPA
jgi:hypothetical protein